MPNKHSAEESPAESVEGAEEAPLNRAERRARGKGKKKQPQHGVQERITGHQTRSGGPRMWTNRRGGG